jgi:hypothetical protein
MQEAVGSEDLMNFWRKLVVDKEEHINELQTLIKKYMNAQ